MGYDGSWRRWAKPLRLPSAALMSLATTAALACSTVMLGPSDRPLVAYSFDFAATGTGFVVVNPAEAKRRSVMEDAPARWATRHGSVTFNQIGPGMPTAGMNTSGLVVSLMWNDGVVYDRRGTGPVLNELEFIQHLLDTSGSVDEALTALNDVRIDGRVPIHFFLADSVGNTAVVTPTAGGVFVHAGEDMSIPALTNTSYPVLMEKISGFQGFGGDRKAPSGDTSRDPNSLERFVIAATASRHAGPSSPTSDQAFDVLDKLANSETRWQIVFDPKLQRIELRITGQEGVHQIDMRKIDFRCHERPLAAELTKISATDLSADLAPVDPAALSAVSRQVFAALRGTADMAPEMADGLTAGLLASVSCE